MADSAGGRYLPPGGYRGTQNRSGASRGIPRAERMSGWSGRIMPLLKTGIFTVLVPGVVAFWVPLRWLGVQRQWDELPESWWAYLGLPLLVFGSCVYLWCAWDFAVRGLGTPAPIDAPPLLVVKGLYRFVRNPMYAGVLAVIRSEEHTSELQSQFHLVCRLLLEKKKKIH